MTRLHCTSLIAVFCAATTIAVALSQEVSRNPKADALKRPEVMRGQATFQENCAACHGTNATGGMGPNLIVSSVVRHDIGGDGIGQVVHEGRLDKGMPAFPQISDAQVKEIAAFLHARIDASMRASAGGGSAFSGQLNVGDAGAGKAYFQAHCASCHNPTGDFAGIAKKHDTAELESLMLAPKAGPTMGTLTLASGESIHGTVLHQDEFSYMLRDASGTVHTAAAGHGVRLAVETPLRAHDDLLKIYTNKDIHDVFTYLETLQ
jgi:cytochrome c oxidase cbb3-type subunit 3